MSNSPLTKTDNLGNLTIINHAMAQQYNQKTQEKDYNINAFIAQSDVPDVPEKLDGDSQFDIKSLRDNQNEDIVSQSELSIEEYDAPKMGRDVDSDDD